MLINELKSLNKRLLIVRNGIITLSSVYVFSQMMKFDTWPSTSGASGPPANKFITSFDVRREKNFSWRETSPNGNVNSKRKFGTLECLLKVSRLTVDCVYSAIDNDGSRFNPIASYHFRLADGNN